MIYLIVGTERFLADFIFTPIIIHLTIFLPSVPLLSRIKFL